MTTNTIIQNSFILIGLISIFTAIFLIQIIEVEFKFVKNCFLDVVKGIVAIFVISKITINLIDYMSKSKLKFEVLKILNVFYESYIWIILMLFILYALDRFIDKKISDNYSRYSIYIINLLLYTSLSLGYSSWMIIILCFISLFVFKMYRYKKVINKKYRDIKTSGKYVYVIYLILGSILIYSSINSIINKSNYEVVIIFALFYLFIYKKYRTKKINKEKDELNLNELSDKEVNLKDRLFETRKKELYYLVKYFQEELCEIEESFAISISGRWGEGKSSLTNILKKEIEDEYIIFDIQPMVTDTRESLIKYFFSNLEKQFIYHGLSVGSSSSIENYFTSILKLIDNKDLLNIKDKVKNIKLNKFDLRESKEDLQADIKVLTEKSGKNILIVVDDFDRVDDEVKYSILTFVKEIVNFNGIKSLILLDYSALQKEGKITYEFLEKFINKRFELSKISTEEILEYYENTLSKENCNGFEDDLNKELNGLVRNISIEINEIIENVKNKLDKEEEELKDLKKDKEKNKEIINIKEEKIKNLVNLKVSLSNETQNTRKLKRIIREINYKTKYIKVLYSEFSNEEKARLNKNINIKNVIIAMILIKVLYEEEYDCILRSKDISRYIDNNKGTEVYELMYCSIFKFKSEIESNYLGWKKDFNLIEFINNVFICINTPKNLCDFRDDQQKMLDTISIKPLNFEGEKTVFENIKDVYNKVSYYNLKDKMENLSEYMSEELKQGNIKLCEAIQLIKTDAVFDGITRCNKKYISTLVQYLKKQKILYTDLSQQRRDLKILNACNMDLINSHMEIIAFILEYKLIKLGKTPVHDIRGEISMKYSIEKVNTYAINLLKDYQQVDIDYSTDEIKKFLEWTEIGEITDISVNYEKIKKEINDMVEIIRDLEIIKDKVENYNLEKENINYEDFNYNERMEILYNINKDVNNELKNEEEIYRLILSMNRIVYLIRLENMNSLTPKDIKILENISTNIYTKYEFKSKDIENSWRMLQLQILTIVSGIPR